MAGGTLLRALDEFIDSLPDLSTLGFRDDDVQYREPFDLEEFKCDRYFIKSRFKVLLGFRHWAFGLGLCGPGDWWTLGSGTLLCFPFVLARALGLGVFGCMVFGVVWALNFGLWASLSSAGRGSYKIPECDDAGKETQLRSRFQNTTVGILATNSGLKNTDGLQHCVTIPPLNLSPREYERFTQVSKRSLGQDSVTVNYTALAVDDGDHRRYGQLFNKFPGVLMRHSTGFKAVIEMTMREEYQNFPIDLYGFDWADPAKSDHRTKIGLDHPWQEEKRIIYTLKGLGEIHEINVTANVKEYHMGLLARHQETQKAREREAEKAAARGA